MPIAYSHVIVHYAEIGTKKGNRSVFEKALARNMRRKMPGEKVFRGYGRLLIPLRPQSDLTAITGALRATFGIANFACALRAELNLDDLAAKALMLAQESPAATFRISARRPNKQFPLSSLQINEVVGGRVMDLGKKVKLKQPELDIGIEVLSKEAFVYADLQQGPGGLPVGSAGRVIALLSGGIDSPVAAWCAMKRGCKVVLIHFHNYTLYQDSVKRKIEQLAQQLAIPNGRTTLLVVPFHEFQQEIIKEVPPEYRMLAYRRAMLRIASAFADQYRAKALVTGDNLAQVASQTLENLRTVYAATDRLILHPLIGYDKQEIIRLAEQLGTYHTSILPYNDCCSAFVATHPATASRPEELDAFEKNIDTPKLITRALTATEVMVFDNQRPRNS